MTITALSQPDYDTDVLVNGAFEGGFTQSADANYDVDISTSSNVTDNQQYSIDFQNVNEFTSRDEYGNPADFVTVSAPTETSIDITFNFTWEITDQSGDLAGDSNDFRMLDSAGNIRNSTNISIEHEQTTTFSISDTIQEGNTIQYQIDYADGYSFGSLGGPIYLSYSFSATPTTSSDYTVNSVDQTQSQ